MLRGAGTLAVNTAFGGGGTARRRHEHARAPHLEIFLDHGSVQPHVQPAHHDGHCSTPLLRRILLANHQAQQAQVHVGLLELLRGVDGPLHLRARESGQA